MGKKDRAGGVAGKVSLGKPRRLTAGLTDHEHPAVAPDGNHIAYYAGEYGSIQIYVADGDGLLARCISPGGNNTQPAWHPDGTVLAFRHQDTIRDKWEIWRSPLLEGEPAKKLLGHRKWHYKHPSFSPDGKRIAYFSDEGCAGVFHLWDLVLKTGKRRQLTTGDSQNHAHPVYSPDGGRIVYHAYEGTEETEEPPVTNLYELELKTGRIRQLTDGAGQYKHPFYVSGALITCHHERNSDGRRWIEAMDLKSGRTFQLTTGRNNDKHPFPWIDARGRGWIWWSSKKLGGKLADEPNTYDIFRAELKIEWQTEKSPGRGAKQAKPKKKQKPRNKWCSTCPMKQVQKGRMTSWKQAKELKVKSKSKACKDCPAREVLG